MGDFLAILLSLSFGVVLGVLSRLIPELHPNTFALIVASFVLLSDLNPLYGAVIILSSSITNTFLDIIPSIFIGGLDPEIVLTVLPSHEMMMDGRGIEAVKLSAFGLLASVFLSFLLMLPFAPFFMRFYREMEHNMGFLLIILLSLLIFSESKETIEGGGKLRKFLPKVKALFIFLLSGFLGYTALKREFWMSSSIFPSSVLFPMLTGFFSVLLFCLQP
jgi:putative membrane protein